VPPAPERPAAPVSVTSLGVPAIESGIEQQSSHKAPLNDSGKNAHATLVIERGGTPGTEFLLTNDESTIRAVMELAHKLGCGIHIHVQETKAETEGCYARYGVSPAQWLEKLGVFSRHAVAAHCVTVSADDIGILHRNGVHVASNPGSNMKLASGIAPVDAMLKAGINVALGTDGASSNNNLDMLEEARLSALCAKLREGDPAAVKAYDALKMATIGGARALGIDSKTGSIEVGKDADIIVFRGNSPSMHPRIDMVSNLLYSASSSDVSMTMVKGRILMEDTRIIGLDLDRIYRETEKISAEICS
jgi:5-methylthioadenosine/S-adenosylhomocysteine deaminase